MRRLVGVAVVLGAAGLSCPGSTPMDPCVGVTCGPGRVCNAGSCVAAPSCGAGPACLAGQTCQFGVCVANNQPDGSIADAPFFPVEAGPDQLTVDSKRADGPLEDAQAPDSKTIDAAIDTKPPPVDLTAPDIDVGRWVQVNRVNCPTFCAGRSMANVPSPDGARCASGEVRPASAIAAGIRFTEGCFGGCAANNSAGAASSGSYCYRPGQKKDSDKTDRAMGCYCR